MAQAYTIDGEFKEHSLMTKCKKGKAVSNLTRGGVKFDILFIGTLSTIQIIQSITITIVCKFWAELFVQIKIVHKISVQFLNHPISPSLSRL